MIGFGFPEPMFVTPTDHHPPQAGEAGDDEDAPEVSEFLEVGIASVAREAIAAAPSSHPVDEASEPEVQASEPEVSMTDPQLVRGSATLLVLAALAERALHGYALLRVLEARSGGKFSFVEGTIYPLLRQLEADGRLRGTWKEIEGRRRRVYTPTRSGLALLAEKRREWAEFRAAVDCVLLPEAAR